MKILFTGGGTAGHVTPNLALISVLKNKAECYYMGTNGMEKDLTAPYLLSGDIKNYFTIRADKLKRKFSLQNFLLPFKLMRSVSEAKKQLEQLRPDVVFSKGGYVGLPVIMAAKRLKIPSAVHESDLSMGLANKLCAHFATVLLSAFPCHKKADVIGAIIRESTVSGSKAQGLSAMGFNGKKPILLVMGGSLGATALNETICRCRELSERFDIFVICGKNKSFDCDFVKQTEFVSNIGDVYAASSIAITRGGSNSLVELTLASVPFVSIPLEKCSRGEQIKNSRFFSENKCGLTLREGSPDKAFVNAVNTLYENRDFYQKRQLKMSYLNGTEKAAEVLCRLASPDGKAFADKLIASD